MAIRKAKTKDAAGVLALMKQLIDLHRGLDKYYKPFSAYRGLARYIADSAADRKKIFLVAEIDGKIKGYFLGSMEKAPFYSSENYIGVVADAAVDLKTRRQGLLKALFSVAGKWFKTMRVKYIELSVDARNLSAVRAWKKLGFKDYKLRLRGKI